MSDESGASFPYNVRLRVTATPDGGAIVEFSQGAKVLRRVVACEHSVSYRIESVRDILEDDAAWPESSVVYDGSLRPPRQCSVSRKEPSTP